MAAIEHEPVMSVFMAYIALLVATLQEARPLHNFKDQNTVLLFLISYTEHIS